MTESVNLKHPPVEKKREKYINSEPAEGFLTRKNVFFAYWGEGIGSEV